MKIRVYHAYYGCDTGCCGHIVEILDNNLSQFVFTHPYDRDISHKEWARELVEQTIKYNWPECLPNIDWDTLDVEDVSED